MEKQSKRLAFKRSLLYTLQNGNKSCSCQPSHTAETGQQKEAHWLTFSDQHQLYKETYHKDQAFLHTGVGTGYSMMQSISILMMVLA